MTYTKEQVEQIVRAYHKWLCNHGVNNQEGLPADFQLDYLDTYNGYIEDGDSMPFSELVDDFFMEYKEVDEKGQPVYTPFDDILAEVIKQIDPITTKGEEV